MTRLSLSICVLLLMSLTDLAAQEVTEITPGAKVRLTVPLLSEKPIQGTVVSFDTGTLVVKSKNQAVPLRIPVDDVSIFKISRGQKTNVLKGAAIGTLAGAGAGLVAGIFFHLATRVDHVDDMSGLYVIGLPIIVAPAGLIIGAMMGMTPRDQWETVTSPQLGVHVVPYRNGGGGVTLSYRF